MISVLASIFANYAMSTGDPQAVLTADGEGRYHDALGLRPDANIDDIRSAQVVLLHRFRSEPPVVAAVNHAAECAAEERCTSVNPIRVKRLVLEASLPQWGVPAQDVIEYLAGSVDLNAVIAEVAQHLRRTGTAGDLELATMDAVLSRLQSEDTRLGMCDWYCRRAGSRLNEAFRGVVGSLSELGPAAASVLRRELLVCRISVRLALSLASDHVPAHSLFSKIEACLSEVQRRASESTSLAERVASLRATANGLMKTGNAVGAVSCLRTVVELYDDAESYFDLGTALSGLGQFEEALRCFQKAAELRGCNEDIASLEACRISLAGLKGTRAFEDGLAALKRGDAPAAVGLFRQSTVSDPRGENYHWLGRALAQLGRLDDALPFLEQAARLRGDQTDVTWLTEVRTQLVKQRREAALNSARRDAERRASASPHVEHRDLPTGRFQTRKLRPIHIVGVALSALAFASAFVFTVVTAVTREAIGVRLLTSACLMAASAGIALWVGLSLARHTRSHNE
jgi:tetratricopeptide (TPR) repeat protein